MEGSADGIRRAGHYLRRDAQGNPTSYLGHTLTWEKGRQLKSFDGIQYTYNANGIRTGKTVNGVTHTYTLDGTKILKEAWGGNTLVPLYDNEDSVCGVIYSGEPFYFFKNLQGDIISIADRNAQVVAKYSYDAWGMCTVEQDTSTVGIAGVNPFRYRGYYFDAEIGMYYLQSRYYDPVVGRFVNADEAVYAVASEERALHNIFFYCNNNPICLVDASGYIAANVIGAIIGGVIGAVGGYFLTNWLADRIGLRGWKRNVFVWGLSALIGATAAAIGYFVGPYVAKAWSAWSAKFAGLIRGTYRSINITNQTMRHINVSKHLWSRVLGKVTDSTIKNLVNQAIKNGTWNLLSNGTVQILYKYKGQIIEVTGKVIDKVLRISDAWVKK